MGQEIPKFQSWLCHYSKDCWLWETGGAGKTLGNASSKEPQKSHKEGAAYTKYDLKEKFRKSCLLGDGLHQDLSRGKLRLSYLGTPKSREV